MGRNSLERALSRAAMGDAIVSCLGLARFVSSSGTLVQNAVRILSMG